MLVNPSQLTDSQQAAIMHVVDHGGHQFVVCRLVARVTMASLVKKGMVKAVQLDVDGHKTMGYALTIDGRIMREQLVLAQERRRRGR